MRRVGRRWPPSPTARPAEPLRLLQSEKLLLYDTLQGEAAGAGSRGWRTARAWTSTLVRPAASRHPVLPAPVPCLSLAFPACMGWV